MDERLATSTLAIIVRFVQGGPYQGNVPIYQRVIRLDVHQARISACVVTKQAHGTLTVEHREYGACTRDRQALAQWAREACPDLVVMESTEIYRKSLHAVLKAVGTAAWLVNARHVNNVPGHKINVGDAHWPATFT